MQDLTASVGALAIEKDDDVTTCDYFGMNGLCGKKVCRASASRCYNHKDSVQKRLCASPQCRVRVADIDGMLCAKHQRNGKSKAKPV